MEYTPGQDIFDAPVECIVNPVNTQAHLLKPGRQMGLAGAFEERFPDIQGPFKKACREGKFKPGGVQMIRVDRESGARDRGGDLVIANLATKDHWRDKSQPEWVDEGLRKLAGAIETRGIRSVALPMLGAGYGGLPWEQVRGSIETHFGPLAEKGVRVMVLGEGPEKERTPAPASASSPRSDHAEAEEATPPRYVTGIGSRKTPPRALGQMEALGKILGAEGAVLRSGAADGADSAFEKGWDAAGGRKEIFLPWDGFNDRHADGRQVFVPTLGENAPEVKIASRLHPAWERLGRGPRALMARNTNQIHGREVGTSPRTDLVICWTEGGAQKGGTGQALRMAEESGIPVLNLGNPRLKGASIEDLAGLARTALAGGDMQSGIRKIERAQRAASR